MLGRWSFLSELREGETPQTQPPVETKEKEYTRRLTRRGNSNVLAHFSSIRVLTVRGWLFCWFVGLLVGELAGGWERYFFEE